MSAVLAHRVWELELDLQAIASELGIPDADTDKILEAVQSLRAENARLRGLPMPLPGIGRAVTGW